MSTNTNWEKQDPLVPILVRRSVRSRLKVNAAIKHVRMYELVDDLSRALIIDMKALKEI